jgi:hypothetical protein
MQNTKIVVNSALVGILALGVLGLSQQAAAAEGNQAKIEYPIIPV